jgi:hypothetical protein
VRSLTQYQVFILALHPEKATFLRNLPSKEKALAKLREETGEDFGDDADKWAAWFKKYPNGRSKKK